MKKDEEIFLAILMDAKTNAQFNNKITLFKFLNLNEQENIERYIGSSLNYYMSAGYEGGEYKRCIISPFDITPDFKITKLKVMYDKRYLTLGHRNILGALMSIGIKREVIGDIVESNNNFYVMCISEMKDYLISECRNSNIRFSLEESFDEISSNEEYKEKLCFLPSTRLDALISHTYNLSRNESYELITKGFVKVNHKECQNTSKQIDKDDLISVRTKGRIKVIDISQTSKSGKIKAVIGVI